jgi:hypothetical protein
MGDRRASEHPVMAAKSIVPNVVDVLNGASLDLGSTTLEPAHGELLWYRERARFRPFLLTASAAAVQSLES